MKQESFSIDTAKLAIPGCDPITTPLLREISLGDLTGQNIGAVRDKYGNLKGNFAAFNGEDQEMIYQRAAEFMQILEKDPSDMVAAFSHNGYMKAVLRYVLGKNFDTTPIANGNCNIAVFKHDGSRWTLQVWNLEGKF